MSAHDVFFVQSPSIDDRGNSSAELTTPARQPAACRATPPLRGGEYEGAAA